MGSQTVSRSRQRAEEQSRFAPASPSDTSGNRKLPDVTHRVFCAMHQAADDGRRQLVPSHAADVAKCCHIDRAKLRDRCVNSCGQGAQDGRHVCCEDVLTFRLNRRELFCRQRVPSGVGEEAIDDSGNMSHMKGDGGYSGRAGVPFALRQRLDDLADTLAYLKKNVRDWLKDGRDAVDGTALPPLGIGHVSSTPLCRAAIHARRRILRADVPVQRRRLAPAAAARCQPVTRPVARRFRGGHAPCRTPGRT